MNIINLIKNFKYIILINFLILIVGIIIDYNNYIEKNKNFYETGIGHVFFFDIDVESQFLRNYDTFVKKPIDETTYYIEIADIRDFLTTLIKDYIYEFTLSYGERNFEPIHQSEHYDSGYSFSLQYYDKSDNFDFSDKLLKDAQEGNIIKKINQFINQSKRNYYNIIDKNIPINKYLVDQEKHKPMTINVKNYFHIEPYIGVPVKAPITIILLMLLALFNLVYFINVKEYK